MSSCGTQHIRFRNLHRVNVNGRNGVDVIFQRKLGLVEQVAYLGEHVGGSMQLQVAVLVAGVVGGLLLRGDGYETRFYMKD